jgi:hypothetical protein
MGMLTVEPDRGQGPIRLPRCPVCDSSRVVRVATRGSRPIYSCNERDCRQLFEILVPSAADAKEAGR